VRKVLVPISIQTGIARICDIKANILYNFVATESNIEFREQECHRYNKIANADDKHMLYT
jgi:hypothetical protein